jgi:hypothetical protein
LKEKLKTEIQATSQAISYLSAQEKSVRLFSFVIDRVLAADWVVHVAGSVLASVKASEPIKKPDGGPTSPVELARKSPGKSTLFLRENSQELLELFVAREVDNFQVYLVEVIRATLKKQPNALKSSKETLTLEYILSFGSTEELLQAVVEQKIQNLSYEGFGRLREWCGRKGIPLEIPKNSEPEIVELIACRNIIAHNRGLVDQRYREAVPSTKFELGHPRTLDADALFSAAYLLQQIVLKTDASIAAKFSLSTTSYGCHTAPDPRSFSQTESGPEDPTSAS